MLIGSLIYHGLNPDLAKNNCLLTREFSSVTVTEGYSNRKSVWVFGERIMDSITLTDFCWKKDKNGIEFLAGKIVSRVKDVCNQSYHLGCIKVEIDNMESS